MSKPMGHGVKQRDLVTMTPDEVDAFLHQRRPMTLATFHHDGTIHAVAMWYGFLEGCVAFETKAKAQKALNLARDPRLTCLAEDGDYYEDLRGVELVGTAEFVEEPERMWELGINLYERYYGAYSDELKPFVEMMLHKRVVIKVNVERTVSWDHRKLGMPSTKPPGSSDPGPHGDPPGSSDPGPHGDPPGSSDPGPHGDPAGSSDPGPHGDPAGSSDPGPHGDPA